MTTPFTILQDEWVMLAPLGDHPHALGIQRFTPTAIQNLANRFNGLFGILGRLFGGAPTFEGHHDIEPQLYPNSKSFGWIMSLEARADGLWGRMNWTPEGRAMLQNGAFKFVSPVFIGKPIGQQNGKTIYDPITFKSLALTNQPNLPLPPLANTKDPMNTITDILQLPNDATAEQIIEAVRNLRSQTETLANQAATRETELTTLQNSLSTRNSELTTVQSAFQAERAARIELILANAIRDNRITLAQQDHWRGELSKDLAAAETALASEKTVLNAESQTRDLGNAKTAYDTAATRQTALTGFISEQMANGLSYDEAWSKAKIERSDIFANMGRIPEKQY